MAGGVEFINPDSSLPGNQGSEQGETVTLQLGDFDRHGTTRARWKSRWIEVEHGIPGETVRAEIVGQKRPRGRIREVLEAAPDRTRPPCPYFRDWSCGGCQWQQITYPGQLLRKRHVVEEAMHAEGLDLVVSAVHALPDPWRYRSTAGIALGKRAGFRRQASLAIVPIHDCPISHPLIGQLMAQLNTALQEGTLPDFHGRVRLDVRVAGSTDTSYLQVLIRPIEERKWPPQEELRTLTTVLEAMDGVGGISLLQPDGSVAVVRGELFATAEIAGRPVSLAAASFFQANPLLLPELIARLREIAQPLAGKRVADVYGGVGVFGLFLAEEAAEVIEIESDPLAVEAGRRTAQQWGLANLRFIEQRAEDALAQHGPYDVIIVDPPRTGLTPAVRAMLSDSLEPLVLYVSCLAESLARDLRELVNAGYRVDYLELFDFYPQTYHVELLAALRA